MRAKSYSVAASESLLPVTNNAFWHWTVWTSGEPGDNPIFWPFPMAYPASHSLQHLLLSDTQLSQTDEHLRRPSARRTVATSGPSLRGACATTRTAVSRLHKHSQNSSYAFGRTAPHFRLLLLDIPPVVSYLLPP